MPGDDDEPVQPDHGPPGHSPAGRHGAALLTLYDRALPQVFGYLAARCGSAQLAEDLTAETFLGAVDAIDRGRVHEVTVAWLIGIARHKLADHWRRAAREERRLQAVATTEGAPTALEDPWEVHLDVVRARQTLAGLGAHHRSVLTLRYLDGLPVTDVAAHLHRSVLATEALLTRAKAAFRRGYDEEASA